MPNALYYGDNLPVLREHVADQSVDLIYLDPPFNSNASYNVLFKSPEGASSEAQIEAFEDSWHWNEQAELAYRDAQERGGADLANLLKALRDFLGANDMTAYLAMMAARLVELRRVLKPTGSLYLHCDPTASHYLKLVLDATFGKENFLNEIVWKRTSAHSSARRYGPVHDVIFFYARGDRYRWNPQFTPHDPEYLETFFDQRDADGRRWKRMDLTGAGVRRGETGKRWRGIDVTAKGRHWAHPPKELDRLDAEGRIHWPRKKGGMPRLKQYPEDLSGVPLQDVITDIRPMHNLSDERLGYPTQKPVALLERIVRASSNPGDLVLDPFCGCGTTIHAAESLGRRWIGIDVTHLAISLIKKRLEDAFPGIRKRIEIHGVPKDLSGARDLAARDKHQFQWWAISLVDKAIPYRDKKRGADSGIDGLVFLYPDADATERAVISVKGGANVGVAMVRDLVGVLDREGARIGVLVTLAEPTRPMAEEAARAGLYETRFGRWPRVQILTVEELIEGRQPKLPLAYDPRKTAPRERKRQDQGALDWENGHKKKP